MTKGLQEGILPSVLYLICVMDFAKLQERQGGQVRCPISVIITKTIIFQNKSTIGES